MEQFAKCYPNWANVVGNGNGQFMSVEDPIALAAFVAFCSRKGEQIFLRGSNGDHLYSVPSLFRDPGGCSYSERKCEQLWYAYQDAIIRLRRRLTKNKNKSRWRRLNLGAVLQHYGMKTPWLDVVRNLHTAVWFATNEFSRAHGSHSIARESGKPHGWISLYVRRTVVGSHSPLAVNDLWEISRRGTFGRIPNKGSLSMQKDGESYPAREQDLNKNYRIGQVRFPNSTKQEHSSKWKLGGHMFTAPFLFPNAEDDDSLKELEAADIDGVLWSVCKCHELETGMLGALFRVRAGEIAPTEKASS